MEEMISILKESALQKDILDVVMLGSHELSIILHDNADVKDIVRKVNEIDSRFWRTREPIKITYQYQDGSGAVL